jgi:hypothetical protein
LAQLTEQYALCANQISEINLFRASSVKVKRHKRIKAGANLYDPEDELYFERRVGRKMAGKFAGRSLLVYLYINNNRGNAPTVINPSPKPSAGIDIT